jgi:hypothetical protein
MKDRRDKWCGRWRGRAVVSCLMGTLVTCAPSVALAQPAPTVEREPSDAIKARARKLFQEGNSLLDAGDYQVALRRFEEAHALWDSPKILLNIATTQRALGHSAAAANAYAHYLERAPADSPSRAEVPQILSALTLLTGRLVVSDFDGVAGLSVDGEELALTAGREIWLEPGEHVVTARRRDGSSTEHGFRVVAGEVARLDLRVSAGEAARAAPPLLPAPAATGLADSGPEEKPSRGPASSVLGLAARVDFDPGSRGAVVAGGLGIELTGHLRLTAGALIGRSKGGWVGVDYAPWTSTRVRPFLGVTMPAFYVDAVYAGIAGHGGIGYRFAERFVPFLQVALVHFPRAPSGYVKTVLVPAAGIEVRL